MTLGRTIALYRKKLGITQDALAQRLEVTNQAVSKWESDQCCPDIVLLPRLADLFEITMDQLFGRELTAPQDKPVNIDGLPWEDDGNVRGVVYVGTRSPVKSMRLCWKERQRTCTACSPSGAVMWLGRWKQAVM